LYAYAGNNPVKYTDPDGRSPIFFTPKDLFSFLCKNDDGVKAAKLYVDAANGDQTAQAVAKEVTVSAGKEMAAAVANAGKTIAVVSLDGMEGTADIVSEVSEDISLIGFATGQIEVAGTFSKVSDGASLIASGASGVKAIITGDKSDMEHSYSKFKKSFASIGFTRFFSRILQMSGKGNVSKFDSDATAAFTNKALKRVVDEQK